MACNILPFLCDKLIYKHSKQTVNLELDQTLLLQIESSCMNTSWPYSSNTSSKTKSWMTGHLPAWTNREEFTDFTASCL